MSSSRLGEKVRPGVLVISRPICAWYVAGNSRHSISTVVLVEGIRTPKWRVMLGAFPLNAISDPIDHGSILSTPVRGIILAADSPPRRAKYNENRDFAPGQTGLA